VNLDLLPPGARVEGDDLIVGGCSVTALAEQFGTPAYVVDEGALRARARRYRTAFTTLHPDTLVCFACKSFPSASVIRILVEEGLGCDVVGGELAFALAARARPETVLMHGNAKTDADIGAALDARIGWIVVDGFDDIERIARLATRRTPVLLRVLPGIEADTHEAMATGGAGAKFGLPADQVPEALRLMRRSPLIEVQGVHAHIGSAVTNLDQFEAAVAALAELERFKVYDVGGGLGVRYVPSDDVPSIEEYARRTVAAVHRHLGPDVRLIVEPGRSMVAPTGVTIYRVVTVKRGARTHVAVDGGMGDNLEPALYGQRFAPFVVGRWDEPAETVDLVGRHCESGDVLVADAQLAPARRDDLVVVPVTGAYCFTMANTYNAAPRPPVVLCRNGAARLAVRRERPDELLAREMGLGDAPSGSAL
jgi:diaminopimelate decarboxylase